MLTKHAGVTNLDTYIDDSGVCPVCNQKFYTRLRVLQHVREKRVRSKQKRLLCRDVLLSGAFPQICSDRLVHFRKHDNDMLRNCRRLGKNKVPVVMHAKRKLAPPLAAEIPRKRLRSKVSPADVPAAFWWKASEAPRCLFSLGRNLQRSLSSAEHSKRRKTV